MGFWENMNRVSDEIYWFLNEYVIIFRSLFCNDFGDHRASIKHCHICQITDFLRKYPVFRTKKSVYLALVFKIQYSEN